LGICSRTDWESASHEYVADLVPIFANVFEALVAGGQFVFSVEHPVTTSCDRGWPQPSPAPSKTLAIHSQLTVSSCKEVSTPRRLDTAALEQARQFLDAERSRVVRSAELKAVTGLTRYDLARQFRLMYAAHTAMCSCGGPTMHADSLSNPGRWST
jgi:hypothetical protein